MENKVKVNLWDEQFVQELDGTPLLEFNSNDEEILRIVNRQYDEIFRLLCLGKTITIANLELINKTLSQAIADAENENAHHQKISIFTADDAKIQNKKLEALLSKNDSLYLTFGLLDYFNDDRMYIKSAPLILMPIRLEKRQDENGYQITMTEHELRLNHFLIQTMMERRIDISYPLDNDFSLIEYLTYVATKVKNNHFSVNNGCFITTLNCNPYFYHIDFLTRKNEISSLPLVKSVSYLNSEFFNLNKSSSMRLKHNFLSLLDLDNEEYKILKRINLRENIMLKTNSLKNKQHLLINILTNFLLNDKSVIITYDGEESHQEILNHLKESHLEQFTLDLNSRSSSRKDIVQRLISQERLEFDVKLLDENRIDEIVDSYYLLKNNFKKLINSLRKTNEPLKLSINRAIYEYYCLKDAPSLNLQIPNADLIDEAKLNEYLDAISTFVKSINNLKCHYSDHPFYGFNNLNLTQEDYIKLKDQITSLSGEFDPAKRAFEKLTAKYHFPYPKTLKEMKCVLNIVSLIPECALINQEWFELEDYDAIQNNLTTHNTLFNNLLALRSKIISIYEDKVFLINLDELNNHLQKPLTRKIIKSYRPFFMKKVRIDETILTRLAGELNEYYSLNAQVENLVKENELFKEFYNEGVFDLDLIKQRLTIVKRFKDYCTFINKESEVFSYQNLSFFNEETVKSLLDDRKRCQIAFNHLLINIREIQKNYDDKLIDMTTCSLDDLERRMSDASKNFISINHYLDFYLTSKKLNKVIPNLSDELIKHHRSEYYIPMFLKRFYYDYVLAIFASNPIFKNNDEEMFSQNIDNYLDFNASRLDMITALIKSNIKRGIKENAIPLRTVENPYLTSLNKDELKVLPLFILLSKAKTSIKTLFPVLVLPVQEVPLLLENQNYHFDLNIIFANSTMKTREVVSGCSRADQMIVFDYKLANEKDNDSYLKDNAEIFISSASQSLNNALYLSSAYQANILKTNSMDAPFKKYLTEKLRQENFVVSQNINTMAGTIDLLVKVPNSSRPTAIIIDHLSYYSLEGAIESINQSKMHIEKLGFAYYRLVTSMYFKDEAKGFENIVNFILKNTIKEKTKQKVSKIKPLVDVLFEEYLDPENAYYKIIDKEEKSEKDITLELLIKTAPVSKEVIINVLGEKSIATLASLQVENIIKVANGFIFLEGAPIHFRRVNRESDYSRNLSFVSNEEISAGIIKLLSQKSMKENELIKLILSSLGLKKMNHSQFFRIQNIINELKDDNLISERDETLYYEEIVSS